MYLIQCQIGGAGKSTVSIVKFSLSHCMQRKMPCAMTSTSSNPLVYSLYSRSKYPDCYRAMTSPSLYVYSLLPPTSTTSFFSISRLQIYNPLPFPSQPNPSPHRNTPAKTEQLQPPVGKLAIRRKKCSQDIL